MLIYNAYGVYLAKQVPHLFYDYIERCLRWAQLAGGFFLHSIKNK